MNRPQIPYQPISLGLALLSLGLVVFYFSWWFLPGNMGNLFLYWPLFAGEIYHAVMILFLYLTLWPQKPPGESPVLKNFQPAVDVFITVAGEPAEVIYATALAAREMRYHNFKIYLLNDGLALNKPNWKEAKIIADKLGITCLTRQTSQGAKAGNINHALRQTRGELVVIFDADMVPSRDFLEKTVPYFRDPQVGFVQTPQYYANQETNEVTRGAWEQQEFFFGAIMRGKDSANAAFICGTNVVIRREALLSVGGMWEGSIAEDFITSVFIHQKGWRSHYVPEVLAQGLAPEDLLSYFKQQLRWARGSLDMLFSHNPLFLTGLSWSQRREYLNSALYYVNGVVVVIDMIMPIIFLFTGLKPVVTPTTSFALFFLPFILMTLYVLSRSSGGSLTFRAISFSQASWTIQLLALKSVLLRQKMAFAITPKTAQEGNFLSLVYPHLAYIALVVIGSAVGIAREGFNPSIATNMAWAFFNVVIFLPFIRAAYPWEKLLGQKPAPAISRGKAAVSP